MDLWGAPITLSFFPFVQRARANEKGFGRARLSSAAAAPAEGWSSMTATINNSPICWKASISAPTSRASRISSPSRHCFPLGGSSKVYLMLRPAVCVCLSRLLILFNNIWRQLLHTHSWRPAIREDNFEETRRNISSSRSRNRAHCARKCAEWFSSRGARGLLVVGIVVELLVLVGTLVVFIAGNLNASSSLRLNGSRPRHSSRRGGRMKMMILAGGGGSGSGAPFLAARAGHKSGHSALSERAPGLKQSRPINSHHVHLGCGPQLAGRPITPPMNG